MKKYLNMKTISQKIIKEAVDKAIQNLFLSLSQKDIKLINNEKK